MRQRRNENASIAWMSSPLVDGVQRNYASEADE
jgi:hypothetical protein